MENTIFSKGSGLAPALEPEAQIEVIQHQLDALRARLHDERSGHSGGLSLRERIRVVRNMCHARNLRMEMIGGDLFSDPAWDILLEVYLADLEQRRICVSSLGIASKIPSTTTIRWLAKLEQLGLVHKVDDPLDGRRVFVSLTDHGLTVMTAHLDECWPLLS